MFVDELAPVFSEFVQQPAAFLGGFFSGFFRLSLAEDPVKSWIDQHSSSSSSASTGRVEINNGRSSGPQSISID